MFVVEGQNRIVVDGGFKRLNAVLNKAILVPCALRAEDFDGSDILECVIEGLRKRWNQAYTDKILMQLNK
jgi:hypothetical protein